MSDETDRTDPPALFFESNEEAAVYFNALLQPHLPTSKDVRDTNEKILIEASLEDIAFNGLGQWFLSSVQHDENGKASWEDREAMECKECIPPKDSRFVVDVSRLADFPVRQAPKGTKGAPYEYENYGAACFFDLQHAPIALWIPNAAWNKDYQNSGSLKARCTIAAGAARARVMRMQRTRIGSTRHGDGAARSTTTPLPRRILCTATGSSRIRS